MSMVIFLFGCDFQWGDEKEVGRIGRIDNGKYVTVIELGKRYAGWEIYFGNPYEDRNNYTKKYSTEIFKKLKVIIKNENDFDLWINTDQGEKIIKPMTEFIWFNGTLAQLTSSTPPIDFSRQYSYPKKYNVKLILEFEDKISIDPPIPIIALWSDSL